MSVGRRIRRNVGRLEMERKLQRSIGARVAYLGRLDAHHDVFVVGDVLNVVPAMPTGADPTRIESIAARRSVAIEGRCARCHAERVVRGRHGRWRVVVEHEEWCPAIAKGGAA